MKIANKYIHPLLLNILTFKDGVEVSGLLLEDTPLSLKRRLQKIRKDLLQFQDELTKHMREINETVDKKVLAQLPEGAVLDDYKNGKDEEKLKQYNTIAAEFTEFKNRELDNLADEEVEVNQEHVSMAMLEAIKTSQNYDWELLELISK